MKLAPFFAISAALHAVAFFCPVNFRTPLHEEFIPVTVLGIDEFSGGSGAAGIPKAPETSPPALQTGLKKLSPANFFRPGKIRAAMIEEPAVSTPVQSANEGPQLITASTAESEQKTAPPENLSALVEAGPSGARESFASLASAAGARSAGSGSGGGSRQGPGGTGQGSGTGIGFADGVSRLTQARYRETPKPLYPERARQEGQQGQVLLRVLVDQEGRTKSVEVSRSSGSETLDHAAVEAIRRWRFSAARYGDKPVESWVRIPVDFRLSDINDR
jgi:periplasmic protein TonB